MQSIQKLINEALVKKDEKPRVRSGLYSPSLFGRCYRLQFYNMKDTPQSNPPDDRLRRVFQAGHLFHDFVQQTIIIGCPEEGFETEVLIEDGIAKGYADLVGKTEVDDIKSVHSQSFHWMYKSKDIESDKKPNVLQVTWYAIRLNKEWCRLVFVSKDDLCIHELLFKAEKYRHEVEGELCDLKWFKTANELPPAEPRAYGGAENKDKKTGLPKECSMCGWKDRCQKEEEVK